MKQKILALLLMVIMLLPSCSQQSNIDDLDDTGNGTDDTTEIITFDISTPIQSPESIETEPPSDIDEPEFLLEIQEIIRETALPPKFDILENSGKELQAFGNFDEELLDKLEKLLQSYDKNIAIAIWSINGMKALSYNTQARFPTGCTIKMPYFYYVCTEFDKGNDSPSSIMTYEEKYFQNGSGKIRYKEYGTKYKLSDLIHLGLSISDNVAYKMLFSRFGTRGYNAFASERGWGSIKLKGMWLKKANPVDFIKVWSEIYEYFKTGNPSVEMLKKACTNTAYSYIHQGLGKVDYSHKSGNQYLPNATCSDAGIMWTGNQYIYAVFTNSEGEKSDYKMIKDAFVIIQQLMNA